MAASSSRNRPSRDVTPSVVRTGRREHVAGRADFRKNATRSSGSRASFRAVASLSSARTDPWSEYEEEPARRPMLRTNVDSDATRRGGLRHEAPLRARAAPAPRPVRRTHGPARGREAAAPGERPHPQALAGAGVASRRSAAYGGAGITMVSGASPKAWPVRRKLGAPERGCSAEDASSPG